MQVLRCLFVHTFCYLLVALVAQDKEAINQLKENKSRVHYHSHVVAEVARFYAMDSLPDGSNPRRFGAPLPAPDPESMRAAEFIYQQVSAADDGAKDTASDVDLGPATKEDVMKQIQEAKEKLKALENLYQAKYTEDDYKAEKVSQATGRAQPGPSPMEMLAASPSEMPVPTDAEFDKGAGTPGAKGVDDTPDDWAKYRQNKPSEAPEQQQQQQQQQPHTTPQPNSTIQQNITNTGDNSLAA